MLSFNEFKKRFLDLVGERKEILSIEERQVVKVNLQLTATEIRFKEKPNIGVCLYRDTMDTLYERYKQCEEMGEIVDSFLRTITKYPSIKMEPINPAASSEFTKKWDFNKMSLQIINRERNRELLENTPYIPFLDLAIIARYIVKDTPEGMQCFVIQKGNCNIIGISEEHLLDQMKLALQNMDSNYSYEEFFDLNILRSGQIHGAVAMASLPVLKKIYKDEGEFYLFPSSQEEVIVLPVKETCGMDETSMGQMVKTINAENVEPEIWLSDHVYFFDGENLSIRV